MCSTNPLMVMVLLTDVLFSLVKKFRSLAFRIQFIIEKLHSDFASVLTNMNSYKEIESMLTQVDTITGKTVLTYLADLELYTFLQINHVNRIANQIWSSKTDIGGSVFDFSTCFYLVTTNKLNYLEDNELRKRFYKSKSQEDQSMAHGCTFVVWKKSMNLRYIIEAIVFFFILMFF